MVLDDELGANFSELTIDNPHGISGLDPVGLDERPKEHEVARDEWVAQGDALGHGRG